MVAKHPYLVGLSGGIGAGKSLVSAHFAHLGAFIIDADQIAHDLTAHSGAALSAIRAAFGDGVFDTTGRLLRGQLGKQVFSDAVKLHHLEAILHPLIIGRIAMQIKLFFPDFHAQIASSAAHCAAPQRLSSCYQTRASYVVLSAPLLFSTELASWCRFILVVDVDLRTQLNRCRLRDQRNSQEIIAIMRRQTTREQRLQRAHGVIDNRADRAATYAQVEWFHHQFCIQMNRGCSGKS